MEKITPVDTGGPSFYDEFDSMRPIDELGLNPVGVGAELYSCGPQSPSRSPQQLEPPSSPTPTSSQLGNPLVSTTTPSLVELTPYKPTILLSLAPPATPPGAVSSALEERSAIVSVVPENLQFLTSSFDLTEPLSIPEQEPIKETVRDYDPNFAQVHHFPPRGVKALTSLQTPASPKFTRGRTLRSTRAVREPSPPYVSFMQEGPPPSPTNLLEPLPSPYVDLHEPLSIAEPEPEPVPSDNDFALPESPKMTRGRTLRSSFATKLALVPKPKPTPPPKPPPPPKPVAAPKPPPEQKPQPVPKQPPAPKSIPKVVEEPKEEEVCIPKRSIKRRTSPAQKEIVEQRVARVVPVRKPPPVRETSPTRKPTRLRKPSPVREATPPPQKPTRKRRTSPVREETPPPPPQKPTRKRRPSPVREETPPPPPPQKPTRKRRTSPVREATPPLKRSKRQKTSPVRETTPPPLKRTIKQKTSPVRETTPPPPLKRAIKQKSSPVREITPPRSPYPTRKTSLAVALVQKQIKSSPRTKATAKSQELEIFTQPDTPPSLESDDSLDPPSPAPSPSPSLIMQINPDPLPVISQVDLNHLDTPLKADKRLSEFHAAEKENPPEIDGKILHIKLNNFLNHISFDKEWNAYINYITGNNGTGKSAFSAAIMFALGATAIQAGRSQKLTDLITNQKDCAKVEITLSNYGSTLPFKTYGSRIIISRTIDKNGSVFKIAKGKWPPEKKPAWRDLKRKELDSIKISLGIMIENSFQNLRQQDSKKFFLQNSDKEMYHIYNQALRFNQCENEVAKTKENLDLAQPILKAKKMDLITSIGRQDAITKQLQTIETMEQLAPKIETLEKEALWAAVIEIEQDIKSTEEERLKAAAIHKECLVKRDKAEGNLKAYKAKFDQQVADLEQMEDDLKKKNSAEDCKRKEITSTYSKIKKLEKRKEHLDKDIVNLNEIVKEVRKAMNMTGKQREIYRNKREEISNGINEICQKILAETDKMRQLKDEEHLRERNIEECEKNERDTKVIIHRIKKKIEENKKKIIDLKKSKGGSHNNWPSEINQLLAKINETKTFKSKPYGPLCKYFSVKSEKWRPIIENLFKSALFNFCTDNIEDRDLLMSLISDVYKGTKLHWPDVYSSPYLFKKHDIESNKASGSKYPTVIDMMDIEDEPVVFNWIVDSLSVERRLLVEDCEEALVLMRPENVPKNCFECHTLDYYTITPDPNYAKWDKKPKGVQSQYLKLSTEDSLSASLRVLYIEGARLVQELTEENEKFVAQVKNTKASKELNERMNKMPGSKEKSKEISKLKNQKNELDDKRNEIPDPASQNDEIQNRLEEIHKKEEEKKALSKSIGEQTELLNELNEEANKLIADISVLNGKIMEFGDNKKTFSRRKVQLTQLLKTCESNLEKYAADNADLEKKMKLLNVTLAEKIGEAEKICERMEDIRDSKTILDEIEILQLQQKSWKELISEKSNLLQEKKHLQVRLHEMKKEIAHCSHLFKALKAMSFIISQELRKSQDGYASLVSGRFMNLANMMNIKATVRIDMDEKAVYFNMITDGTANARTCMELEDIKEGKNNKMSRIRRKEERNYVRNLSGGERVVATFFLLLATWSAMESPFHLVDEVDVYLDSFRQGECLQILFKHMEDFSQTQFFVISPLEDHIEKRPPQERFYHIRLKKPDDTNDDDSCEPD